MSYPSFDEIMEAQYKLHEMKTQYWLGHDLFTWQWFLLLVLFIFPWIAWYKLIPKVKKSEVLTYGLLLGVLASQLDEIGMAGGAWSYPYQLIQTHRGLNPYNFSVIPVAYMLVYYHFPKWKHFIIGNTIIAIVAAFVAEPLLKGMGIYQTYYWKSIYSFPIYILLPIVFRVLTYYLLEKNKTEKF